MRRWDRLDETARGRCMGYVAARGSPSPALRHTLSPRQRGEGGKTASPCPATTIRMEISGITDGGL